MPLFFIVSNQLLECSLVVFKKLHTSLYEGLCQLLVCACGTVYSKTTEIFYTVYHNDVLAKEHIPSFPPYRMNTVSVINEYRTVNNVSVMYAAQLKCIGIILFHLLFWTSRYIICAADLG